MKIKYLIIILMLISTIDLSTASNPYEKIYTYEVYFNDKLLPGTDIAKPILKIQEPFNIKVNMTVYQEYKVSGKLTELGEGDFEITDGPSKMDQYSSIILNPNKSHVFEWTVRPTDKWAGGSLPVNFHYSIVEKGNPKPLVNSEFTVAYCTISNEHYKDEAPTPKDKEVLEPEPTTTSNPASTQGFSLVALLQRLHFWFQNFSPVEEYYKNLEPLES